MSEKMTTIRLPGTPRGWGYMDYGEKTAEEMIALLRCHVAHLRAQVEAIEAASDADFQIDLVRGSVVQHYIKTIQKSANPAS